ncbi:hypothetical protein NDU88_005461, partial [Pleurodeles waltl]
DDWLGRSRTRRRHGWSAIRSFIGRQNLQRSKFTADHWDCPADTMKCVGGARV